MIRKINFNKIQEVLSLLNLSDLKERYKIDPTIKLQFSSNISGGQAQRLAIARALYRSPEIIIFDESFNNLDKDNKTDIMNFKRNQ